MRTSRPAAAPRFPVLRGRISADGAATLDGRTVATDTRDPERALLAAAAATAGLYGHAVRLNLTEAAGRPRRLVVSPDGPVYPETTRQQRRRPRREHPDPVVPPGGGHPHPPRPRRVDRDTGDLDGLPHPDPPDRRRRLADRDPGADRMSTHPVTSSPVRTPRTPPPTTRPPTTPATPATDPVEPSAVEDPRPVAVAARPLPVVNSDPPRPVALATPPPAASPGRDVRDLLPARLSPADRPAAWGWRGRVVAATGGRVRVRAGRIELRHRDRLEAVLRPLVGARTVVVVNPKGGAGKTPAALLLAATLGAHRGSALAWDNNETRGTLGLRALAPTGSEATVWDLLADLDHFETIRARIGDLAGYLRPQGEARFDVLASDADPGRMAQVDGVQFRRLREVLARFYGVVVVDTGNNVRARNWQAALDAADAVVVTTTDQTDTAISADWALDHLRTTGRERLADTAVTVISAATPRVDHRHRARLVEHFTDHTRAVVQIPYDPAIATGERLDLYDLRPATREAWLTAAAAVLDGLSPTPETGRDA